MSSNPYASEEFPNTQTSGPPEGQEPGGTWGRVIGLDNDADLKFDGRGGWARRNDDVAVVQDLKVSMMTPEGEDPLRANYGRNLFRLLGRSLPMFRSEVERVMLYDPRVQRVVEVDVDFPVPNDRENVEVEVTVELEDGTIRGFVFPVRDRREFQR